MEEYTFEMMYEDLRNGYQIYYTYVKNRYLLFKTAKNCYTQKLISNNDKNAPDYNTLEKLWNSQNRGQKKPLVDNKALSHEQFLEEIQIPSGVS